MKTCSSLRTKERHACRAVQSFYSGSGTAHEDDETSDGVVEWSRRSVDRLLIKYRPHHPRYPGNEEEDNVIFEQCFPTPPYSVRLNNSSCSLSFFSFLFFYIFFVRRSSVFVVLCYHLFISSDSTATFSCFATHTSGFSPT